MALAIIPLSGIVCPPVIGGARMMATSAGAANTTPYTPTTASMSTPSTSMIAASGVLADDAAGAYCPVIDSDNVRLLRPVRPGSGFVLDRAERQAPASSVVGQELSVCTICTLTATAAATFADEFERAIAPVLAANGAAPLAVFETEPSVNNFPRLPVREGEHAFVWFARFPDGATHREHVARLEESRDWRELVRPMLDRQLQAPMESWRLTLTAQSRLAGWSR
jgi:hypothetical protein